MDDYRFPEKAKDLKFTAHSLFSPQCPLTLEPPMEAIPEKTTVASSPPNVDIRPWTNSS